MKRVTVRELHLKTSAVIKDVAEGRVYVIERKGTAVAELRPIQGGRATRALPDREDFFKKIPRVRTDSGRILEEDRS